MNNTPYLTAREAAEYLNIKYSTFRKKACRIKRTAQTKRYLREDLDAYALSLKPRKNR